MKPQKFLASILTLVFLSGQAVPFGYALPELDEITHGEGRAEQNGNVYNFHQETDKLVARFKSFNIDIPETVNVLQPSRDAAALFRILDQNPSQIFGSLNANGNLFLLNPNGILFGQTARVNVGGLVASSLDLSEERFLNGQYLFTSQGAAGLVSNQGVITAAQGGTVALLGGAVRNEGILSAPAGSVLLGAGRSATLSLDGRGLMNVAIDEAALSQVTDLQGNPVAAAASNSGTLAANGGLVQVSAKAVEGIFDRIINHSGLAEAKSVSVQSGKIIFDGGNQGIVDVTGKMDATGLQAGQKGGEIQVLGGKTALYGGASADVSGDAAGGVILVGGDYQGGDGVQTAAQTYVGSSVTLRADAETTGDGGKIVVWSEEATQYYGSLSAKGGAESGNGGFAEVSGKQNLAFGGQADLSAPRGRTGTLLLDPQDIRIKTGAAPPVRDDAQVADSAALFADDGGATDYEFNETTVEALTANVIFQAQRDFILEDLSDGSLSMANLTGGESFVVQAGRHITFNDTVDTITTAGADIHLEADSPHSSSGAADGTGALTLGGLSSGGGAINLIGADFALSGNIQAGTGNIAIARSTTAATFELGTIAGAQLADAELDLLSSTGIITLGRAATKGTDGAGASASTLTNGAMTLDDLTQDAKNFTLISSAGIDDDDDTGSSLVTSGKIALIAGGAIGSAGGSQGLNVDVDKLEASAGTGIFITDSNELTLGGVTASLSGVSSAGQSIKITSGNDLNVDEAVTQTSGGDILLAAKGPALGSSKHVTLGADVTASGGNGNITIAATDRVELSSGADITAAGTGDVTLLAGEDLTDSETVFNQDGRASGDVVMANASSAQSQDGDILIDARRSVALASANADSDSDNSASQVTVNARSGSITDANDTAGIVNNVTAQDFSPTAATNIGSLTNAIEANAVTVTPISTGGSVDLSLTGTQTTTLQNASVTGDLSLNGSGNLLVEGNFSGGTTTLDMGGSILALQEAGDDLTANHLVLRARSGVLGTPEAPLHLISQGGAIDFLAGTEINGMSVNIDSNVSRDGLQFIAVPPGLVMLNNGLAGGQNYQRYASSHSDMHYFLAGEALYFGQSGGIRPNEVAGAPLLHFDRGAFERTLSLPVLETDVLSDLSVAVKPAPVAELVPSIPTQQPPIGEVRRPGEPVPAKVAAPLIQSIPAPVAEEEKEAVPAEEGEPTPAAIPSVEKTEALVPETVVSKPEKEIIIPPAQLPAGPILRPTQPLSGGIGMAGMRQFEVEKVSTAESGFSKADSTSQKESGS